MLALWKFDVIVNLQNDSISKLELTINVKIVKTIVPNKYMIYMKKLRANNLTTLKKNQLASETTIDTKHINWRRTRCTSTSYFSH